MFKLKLKVVLVSPYSDFKALQIRSGEYLILETSEELEIGDIISISDTDMGHVSFNYLGMLCYGTNQDIVNKAGLSKYFR